MLIENCSPTMAGLKTGSLFSCAYESKSEVEESVRFFNLKLVPRGVRMVPVRFENGRVLIYVYRPDRLSRDLNDEVARAILSKKAYPTENAQLCVAELAKRLRNDSAFPHEIGLFLGYPSSDVDGFIRNKAKGAKLVGTWKVYSNEEAAREKFALFKKCTRLYKKAYSSHSSFDRLIVKRNAS